MLMLLPMALAIAGPVQDDVVARYAAEWEAAVAEVERAPQPDHPTLAQKVARLVALDEITRQHMWRAGDPALSPAQQIALSLKIGPRMSAIDAANTEALKALLPADGWFRNRRDGRQVTHGAWLIVQHSPDDAFRTRIMGAMGERLGKGDVDAMDFALTTDRVVVHQGGPQVFGSQAGCIAGKLTILPIADPEHVDERRARIGWAKTLAETKGDLEIGKPCAM
ncbi:hypothetical protein HZY97_08880 [Sphingomonas sp. R-74633]|uniref:DUF6624 domain-containing protein n=1 Tax=Sphingomonas sp. R-74633 TaxID=2751188 RepID=UPI0015D157F9|nr:DUF6624 domain-containing protein [Sphingomonas sp. R-74633]NYT40866.1 hypothetical protein [Sphingomonas sp. R-74633]